ncbi:MAG: hypothetical protein PHO62_02535 [Sulfurimonas sp.]|uniref:hypothetical protein n=1 Tax=Sulfurimonas sp. TaxID=2022749 RepID=UPI00261EB382|nr:hypothetical protein [Sulfurimonas sp.]MDD5372284.1 hypothetical protein [Sulfurimonas sp.]
MKKIILLFFIFINFVYAFSYNDILLKSQASIFPKIILLDKKLNNKLIDGKIVYTIVYEKDDYDTALEISKFMDAYYKGYFNEYIYKINLVEFSNLSNETEASAIYVLNSDKYIKKTAEVAKRKGIVTFAYDINNLKNGLLFSLMLEKSSVLYLNKESLNNQAINFVDSLYLIVKFIDERSNYKQL